MYFKYYAQALWEFPQFILSIILGLYHADNIHNMKWREGSLVLRVHGLNNPIALGKMVLIDIFTKETELVEVLAVAKKSLWFGPLYLPLVVLPHIANRYWRNRFK